MIITKDKVTNNDIVTVQCDECPTIFDRKLKNVKTARRRQEGKIDLCLQCARKAGAAKRPQNSKEFWQDNMKSEAYYEAIKNRDTSGSNNGMFGKTFSTASKIKRAKIWKNRTGPKATNWKGGKAGVNKMVKSGTQRLYNWFHRVMERDNKTCQHCLATKNLDVHHIVPLATIIKELLIDKNNLSKIEKVDWLLKQPKIIDENLENGITLCRPCHRNVHQNWGSHEPKVQ